MTTRNLASRQLRGISHPMRIDAGASNPIYRQIYEAYRARIRNGSLHVGELVPSTRELARELGVSRAPLLNAYAQLLAEGYFECRVGAGTFVSASLPQSTSTAKRNANFAGRRETATNAAALPHYERPTWAESLGPFQVGQPALQDFPIEIWSRLIARLSRQMGVGALMYGDPMGLRSLREVLANYLRLARAVRCDADQIMIVSGSQQALDLTTRVLLGAGESAWVEEPGYWLIHYVLKASGCRIVPVPVDDEGLNVSEGMKLDRTAYAAFVAPSHQYPLGVTMSVTRRFELLQWAQTAGAWIVEDDYDSEYRYDSMPIPSLQGMDADHRVIYIGSFSKVLFPSLRIGYIVIPPDLIERFAAVRQATDMCPAHASQAALAQFIREGLFSRHIRKMRKLYEERRRLLVEAVRSELGDTCQLVGDKAGMHIALLFDDRMPDAKIAAQAVQHKLWLSALSLSYAGSEPRRGFVLGFGNSPATRIKPAVRLLKRLLEGRH